jgi:hypothetical protein
MTLQYQLETLEGLDEGIQRLYVQKDGKFYLDVTGHEKPDDNKDKIPLSRLNQEIEKRKLSDKTLNEIAESFVNQISEDKRDIIPDLPPAQKIKWIQNAQSKGFFEETQTKSIDSKKPGDKPPENTDNMSSIQLIEHGLNNQKN